MSRYLDLSQIGKIYPTPKGNFEALKEINLVINQGEFVSLIGHSGCGKSTILDIVAGLQAPTTGGVILEGKEIREPGPDRAVVFQNHALMPWLTVYENVELAAKNVFRGKKNKQELKDWVEHSLALVNMGHALTKMPAEISGGMKQRVGIARALAMQPKVLIMDEPFGALDALTRAQLQDVTMRLQLELGNTVIMVTHDVDEAVLLADRIVMMNNGPSATIGQIVEVNIERPRDRLALAEDPVYNHCRHLILDFLYAAHSNPEADELNAQSGAQGSATDQTKGPSEQAA